MCIWGSVGSSLLHAGGRILSAAVGVIVWLGLTGGVIACCVFCESGTDAAALTVLWVVTGLHIIWVCNVDAHVALPPTPPSAPPLGEPAGEARSLLPPPQQAFLARLEAVLPRKAPRGQDVFRSQCAVCLQPLARLATWPLYTRLLPVAVADRVAIFLGEHVRGPGPDSRCPHVYHAVCIELWLERAGNATCPLCRQMLLEG